MVRVFGEDTHSRAVVVLSAATARDVCHILVESSHCTDEENWALLEQHPLLGLGKNTRSSYDTCASRRDAKQCRLFAQMCLSFEERCLEDHEVVSRVQSSWPQDGDTKLLFRKNYAKYEFFKKPAVRSSTSLTLFIVVVY